VKRFVFAVLLLGCGDATPPAEEPIPPQSGGFSALTYNVAGLPQGISSSDPEQYIPLISPLLNGYELVLVQEDFAYHEQLIANVMHPHLSEPKEDNIKLVADGLNRMSQFPIGTLVREQWVVCYGDATTGAGDCLAEKGFSFARMTFGDRVTIDVYNLHADAGGGPEDIAAREQGIAQLIAFIEDRSAGRAVIVAGDTNLQADDAPDAALLATFMAETGLDDACATVGCNVDRIDRFFHRSGDQIEVSPTSWRIADEFVDAMGNDLSDHEAIHVDFDWRTVDP
jgi:hypothetical protein